MPTILLATDADWILDEVDAALSDGDTTVFRVREGIDVLQAIEQISPELVILDEQIGNMGGIAACMAIRNAESVDRIPITAVLLLLDRAHDVFLARRCEADGFVVKPFDSIRLRRAASALLAGEAFEDSIAGIGGSDIMAEPEPEPAFDPADDAAVVDAADAAEPDLPVQV
ncbi:MAG: response regulator [Acidobacteria bacterium]|nr:response regulator [Acidobacteriota bacterium]